MKKVVIAGVVLALLLGSYGLFLLFRNQRNQAEYTSFDDTRISFDGISTKTVEKDFYGLSFYVPDAENYIEHLKESNMGYTYEKAIENSDGSYGDRKRYYFFYGKHVFFLETWGNLIGFYEALLLLYPGDEGWFVPGPFDRETVRPDSDVIPWELLLDVKNFEELVTFYSYMDESLYEIDDENQCIYLSAYTGTYEGKLWKERAMKLTATEEGLATERLLEAGGLD